MPHTPSSLVVGAPALVCAPVLALVFALASPAAPAEVQRDRPGWRPPATPAVGAGPLPPGAWPQGWRGAETAPPYHRAHSGPADGGSNVIFVHPDGSGLNHWSAARIYWRGPDGLLQWDRLPQMAVYRGHMADQLTGTSNGGATTHAFGVKVQGPDSFGTDRGRAIRALSGFPGSLLREAAHRGHPVGVVNDGDVNGEPGTGAFLAETATRGEPQAQALQILGGRPGFDGGTPGDIRDGEPDPVVVLGGGERFFLPRGAPRCAQAPTLDAPRLDCHLHTDPVNGRGPAREDGRNLLAEAAADGWTVIRTRGELDALASRVQRAMHPADPWFAPKVLGLFAADDLFNDEAEERLIELGLLRGDDDPPPAEGAKGGRLVIWGASPGDPQRPFSARPPTVAEMTELALLILDRRSRHLARKPFALVVEVESSDNLANRNNAIGTLRALRRADDAIGVARAYAAAGRVGAQGARPGVPRRGTLVLTAADSDAGSLQVVGLRPGAAEGRNNPVSCPQPEELAACTVTAMVVNPGAGEHPQRVALDGTEGRGTAPFQAGSDAILEAEGAGPPGAGAVERAPLPFAVAWTGVADVAGGILARAEGPGAEMLRHRFSARFDNTDVYRLLYASLFGRLLPPSVGVAAPTR